MQGMINEEKFKKAAPLKKNCLVMYFMRDSFNIKHFEVPYFNIKFLTMDISIKPREIQAI